MYTDRDRFIAQNTKVTELITNAKTSYFKETLENTNAKNHVQYSNHIVKFYR